eukprot:TRINITY_DN543_c0_g1_i1.p1 TRINITY_DN543_c0_g1~~TRINITY_DN543_c0_g1_i1.p1  ORF type:complete len:400 (+),score=158.20 TRINITY_DN543_c0_g1_i1:100-1299(+)
MEESRSSSSSFSSTTGSVDLPSSFEFPDSSHKSTETRGKREEETEEMKREGDKSEDVAKDWSEDKTVKILFGESINLKSMTVLRTMKVVQIIKLITKKIDSFNITLYQVHKNGVIRKEVDEEMKSIGEIIDAQDFPLPFHFSCEKSCDDSSSQISWVSGSDSSFSLSEEQKERRRKQWSCSPNQLRLLNNSHSINLPVSFSSHRVFNNKAHATSTPIIPSSFINEKYNIQRTGTFPIADIKKKCYSPPRNTMLFRADNQFQRRPTVCVESEDFTEEEEEEDGEDELTDQFVIFEELDRHFMEASTTMTNDLRKVASDDSVHSFASKLSSQLEQSPSISPSSSFNKNLTVEEESSALLAEIFDLSLFQVESVQKALEEEERKLIEMEEQNSREEAIHLEE